MKLFYLFDLFQTRNLVALSFFGFPLVGEKSCDQLLMKEERDLPPYLRCSKVEMSLLMTLFLVRGSKEMIEIGRASCRERVW